MKRFFYILAAIALLTFPACSQVEPEVVPAAKISFKVANYVAAPETKNSSLTDETTQFQAKAFLHASDGAGSYLATQDMFGTGGELVTFHAAVAPAAATWEPAGEYFWPKAEESYINFVGWYTANAKSQLSAASISETAMDWGTDANPITIVSDDNILFAEEAWRFKDNATNYLYDNVEKGVPMLFHHALAQVAFNMKLKTTKPSARSIWKVEIQSASLKIANNGYLALRNTDPSADRRQVNWKVGGSDASSAIVGWARPAAGATTETIGLAADAFQALTFTGFKPAGASAGSPVESSAQEFLAMRTVMPQTLGSTVKFALTFKISIYHADASGNQVGDSPYSQEVVELPETDLVSLVSGITDWKMNTKITYNVSIDPVSKQILFDPAVVSWNEVGPANSTQIND